MVTIDYDYIAQSQWNRVDLNFKCWQLYKEGGKVFKGEGSQL